MEKIGVIGCSGFIGSHLLEKLLTKGNYSIIGIDLVKDKIEHILNYANFTFKQTDSNDPSLIEEMVKNCDSIISLAALCNPALYNTIPLKVIDSNFTQPYTLVELCAKYKKRLIHFSTCEVYGKTIRNIGKNNLKNPDKQSHYVFSEDSTPLILGPVSAQRWSYAAAKQLLERVIYAYGEQGILDYTIIRPFNFIGSRMDFIPGIDGEGIPRVIACFMEALLMDKSLKLVDGGNSTRSFTSIHDAVKAIVKIIERPEKSRNQIFNIGNPNNEIFIHDLAETMVLLYKKLNPLKNNDIKIISVPSEEFYGKGYEDSDKRVPDISKAKRLLGWTPTISLEDTLQETIISYIKYYGKKDAA